MECTKGDGGRWRAMEGDKGDENGMEFSIFGMEFGWIQYIRDGGRWKWDGIQYIRDGIQYIRDGKAMEGDEGR